MSKITLYNNPGRPSLLGRSVWDEMFDSFFDAAPNLVRRSTEGYPVTDIYKDDDGNSVIECALAGFTKDQLSVEVKDGRITITADGGAEDANARRIARRSFQKTFVAPDNKLDMSSAHASFENGLLRVIVPPTPEAQPVSINIS